MLGFVRLWIFLSTVLVAAGWILSALRQLNQGGYAVVLVLAAAFIFWQRDSFFPTSPVAVSRPWSRYGRRFRRLAPFIFLVIAAMTFLGGAIYAPLNPDTNSYRIPRVLNWLWQQQWHFIQCDDSRLNIAAPGWEWLAAPLISFSRGYDLLFLITWIPYLLMPGMIFSMFRKLGISGRVAWWWMWLLPSGWCYIFQAGSSANDAFACIYALAAVDFALRARQKNSVADLWWSILAVALVTGAKQTNIPLALLWFVPACTGWRLLIGKPFSLLTVGVLAILISAVPVTVSNYIHYGNWMGMVPGHWKGSLDSPFWGLVGNAFAFPAQNLLPPFFPWSDRWNAYMDHFAATPFGSHFSSFEHFGILSKNLHGIAEENAALGLGLCVLILVTVVWGRFVRVDKTVGRAGNHDWVVRFLRIAPWGLMLIFWAKVGTYENGRQFAPYYAFLFPSLLALRGQSCLVRRVVWQWLGMAVLLLAAFILIISRVRPMFPAQTLFSYLKRHYPASHVVNRAAFAFDVRSANGDELRSWLKQNIPPQETIVGLASPSCMIEPQLWLPLGSRAIERVLPSDSATEMQAHGFHYVIVEKAFLEAFNTDIATWDGGHDAELLAQYQYQLVFGQSAEEIYLVRLRPETPEKSL